jgi:hypothetical protein
MSEVRKTLVIGDRFKIEAVADHDGRIRLIGNFADGSNITLRADETARIRWRDRKVELVIEATDAE